MLKSAPFVPPVWASVLRHPPAKKLRLGHFPTPIFPFSPPGLPEGVRMFIKRDDFSGMETSGNKIRKLEFLLAEALEQQADCIVTCGGIQSNHCRATAAVARMLGLESYLLLRTNKPEEDPGLVGNVLFDRMLDANLIQMSRQEYGKYGSEAMIKRTCDRLRLEGRRPYAIPVGGSNGVGTWGYIQAMDEINNQLKYFHGHIDGQILPAMGAAPDISSRQFLQITNAQGTGYARSSKKELEFIYSVSRKTGVLMDPVYSGKALFHLIRELNEAPEKFVGKSILFIHTGGQFGMYDKVEALQEVIRQDQVERFVMELQTAGLTRAIASRSVRFASSVTTNETPYYDVVVAGGGVMGFSTAYHLAIASPKLKIAVVEKDPCYKYASAILSAGGIRHQFSEKENIEMSLYGTEFLSNIGTNMKVDGHDAPDVQFVEGGYMFLASERGMDVLNQNYATQKASGADVQLLDPVALKKRFPWINTDGVEQAILGMKDQGWFDPWAFLNALKRKSVALGVDVLEGEVKHFDLGGQNQIEKVHIEVQNSPECGDKRFDSVGAGVVVNAAGCWSSKLLEACGSFDYPRRSGTAMQPHRWW
uniref:Tryptophan synthase beta chain-like PALP domain-containing protein n=1 Tax=Phytophthora ramorum TaxID=164328 RepID=H3HBG1_PHYRM